METTRRGGWKAFKQFLNWNETPLLCSAASRRIRARRCVYNNTTTLMMSHRRHPISSNSASASASASANANADASASSHNRPKIHKGYTSSRLSYFRGWAYQQVYLNRRINYKRSVNANFFTNQIVVEDSSSSCAIHEHEHEHDHDVHDDNCDRILFFEHDHVYTLGRGANENNLTFLNEDSKRLLSRKNNNRGVNTSRLYVDKFKGRPKQINDARVVPVHHRENINMNANANVNANVNNFHQSIHHEVNSMGTCNA